MYPRQWNLTTAEFLDSPSTRPGPDSSPPPLVQRPTHCHTPHTSITDSQHDPHTVPSPPNRSNIKMNYCDGLGSVTLFSHLRMLMLQQILSTVEGYGLDVAGSAERPEMVSVSGVPRGVWGGFNPPPPHFRSVDKAEPNSQSHGKYIRNNLIRIRVPLICKLSGAHD
jgi:hypothetical protein